MAIALGTILPLTGDVAPSQEETVSYTIYVNGDTYYARNGSTGEIDYSGTNASTVIQSAVNALSNGGRVFLKQGTYLLKKQGTHQRPGVPEKGSFCLELPHKIALVGENREATILKQDAGQNVNLIIQTKDKGAYHGGLISDLTVDGNWLNQDYSGYANAFAGTGIKIYGDRWIIQRVVIKNTGNYGGLWFQGADCFASELLIDTTYSHDARYDRWAAGLGFTYHTCINNRVTNVIIKNTKGIGLYFEDSPQHNTVSNVYIENAGDAGIAFEYGSRANNVIGGDVLNSGKQGVHVWGNPADGLYTMDNKIIGLSISNSKQEGIKVRRAETTHIQNNIIRYNAQNPVSGEDRDITISSSTGTKIEGNTFVNTGTVLQGRILLFPRKAISLPKYYVKEEDGSDFTSVQNNTMLGKATSAGKVDLIGPNSKCQNNIGYVTESEK